MSKCPNLSYFYAFWGSKLQTSADIPRTTPLPPIFSKITHFFHPDCPHPDFISHTSPSICGTTGLGASLATFPNSFAATSPHPRAQTSPPTVSFPAPILSLSLSGPRFWASFAGFLRQKWAIACTNSRIGNESETFGDLETVSL